MSRTARRGVGAGIGLCLALALPAPATAGTIALAPPVVVTMYVFTGSAGEANDVILTPVSSDRIQIADDYDIVNPLPPACSRVDAKTVVCPRADGFVADGADGSDSLLASELPFGVSLSGGPGDDALTGGAGDDSLTGGAGTDTIDGRGGDDVLTPGPDGDTANGGAGIDLVSYTDGRTAPIVVDLNFGLGVSTGETDLLSNIEDIRGTPAPDDLTGSAAANTIHGMAGADELKGSAGDDFLVGADGADVHSGGPGLDVASYRDRTTGIIASLRLAPLDGDAYAEIEGLEGGPGDDILQGDDAVNMLIGNSGSDTLDGGLGADLLFGNTTSGTPDGVADTVSYGQRATPVTSSLAGAHQDGDSYSDIQNLTGGQVDDNLTGDAGPNALDGGFGNDGLTGGAGPDVLIGASGDDTVRIRDAEADRGECGVGFDSYDEDPVDVLVDCESDLSPEASPPPIDRRAPNTRIPRHPKRVTRSRRAYFGLASTERGSTFQCKLDRGPWRPCTAKKIYPRLKRARHTFRARARDRAGNVDRTPAIFRWRIRR